MISIIIPVFNSAKTIREVHHRLIGVLKVCGEPYEIIAVDNGSTDESRKILQSLSPVTAVLLSKNFGENAALDAGFKMAIGDFIITIDGELACNPEDVLPVLKKLKEGFGAVSGWRKGRQGSLYARILSSIANAIISASTHVRLNDYSSSLKGYRREFIDGIQLLGNTSLFMPIFASDRGARVAEIPISASHGGRIRRRSVSDALCFLFDLVSVKFLLNYFSRPLRFFGSWAVFFGGLAVGAAIVSIALKILHSTVIHPVLLPLVGVMFVILSIILFMLGFVTEILLRIYYERKDNAPYLIYEVLKNK